jgi:hypothetical protein
MRVALSRGMKKSFWARGGWALATYVSTSWLAGCAESSEGALGQTVTSPECAPSDLVCAISGLDAPLALGATLPVDIRVTAMGSAAPPLALVSGNAEVLGVDGNRITGAGRGIAALLAVAPDGRVVDFLHLFVAQPDSLDLRRLTPEGVSTSAMPSRMQLLVGDEMGLVATPALATVRLLGEVDAAWSVEGESVLILDEGIPNQRRLVAREAGIASVRVDAIDLSAEIELEVLL